MRHVGHLPRTLSREPKEVTRIVRTTALDASDALRIAACPPPPPKCTLFYVFQFKTLVPGEVYHVGMFTKIRVKRMSSQLEVSIRMWCITSMEVPRCRFTVLLSVVSAQADTT